MREGKEKEKTVFGSSDVFFLGEFVHLENRVVAYLRLLVDLL